MISDFDQLATQPPHYLNSYTSFCFILIEHIQYLGRLTQDSAFSRARVVGIRLRHAPDQAEAELRQRGEFNR